MLTPTHGYNCFPNHLNRTFDSIIEISNPSTMSASTVSITAKPAVTRRKAAVISEKKADIDASPITEKLIAGIDSVKNLSQSIRGESALERSREAVKKSLPTANALPRRTTRKSVSKTRWQTVASVFSKNLLLLVVLLGLVQMIRKLALGSGSANSVPQSSNFEGRMADMESFFKATTKMMQVQVEVIDRKIEKEIAGLRKGLRKEIIDNIGVIGSRLEKLDGTVDNLEKLNAKYGEKEWVAREVFDKFLEEFKKIKGFESNIDVDLDDIRAFAKKVIQSEIEKHAADGLGMVDYALATGGAMVVKHSEPYVTGKLSSSWFQGSNINGVHNIADKMLRPSLGEPGECFPLKGSNGFFIVRLRTAIVPEAVTLEHVAKSVAYDRSSAPKDCKVSGWLGSITRSIDDVANNVVYLTEFTYDLERSNAQTFKILSEGDNVESSRRLVDTVRLDFTSNHGSPSHTCVYRFRIHGYEP